VLREQEVPRHMNAFLITNCKSVIHQLHQDATPPRSYTRRKCRVAGIDGASQQEGLRPFDALLLCDGKAVGQQVAAEAGYPIICIPIGVDEEGLPVSLSIQHSAWMEAELVKWASAIEDAVRTENPWRPLPQYRNATAKNIPIET